MLKKKSLFKKTIFTTLILTISLTSSQPQALTTLPTVYYNNYDINLNTKYASINDHDIYIVKDNTTIQYNDKDIFIIDLREEQEDIKIVSSYRIKNNMMRNEIINIILKYNETYPAKKAWIRSQKSLNNEWTIHNILYYFYLYRDHTKDVDFETNEEKIYSLSLFNSFVNNSIKYIYK